MSHRNCPQEESVSNAVRTGTWDDSTSLHVAECQLCREIVGTSRWMHALAASTESGGAPLPNASLLWWRAQLAEADRKLIARRRAAEWLRAAPVLLVCFGVLVWIVSNWRAFESALVWLSSDVWSRIVFVGYVFAIWEPNLLWPALVLLSLIVALIAYPLLERV